MPQDAKHYWRSPEERDGDPQFLETAADEFPTAVESEAAGPSRRDFLTAAGFAFAGLALGGCSQAPERLALPLVNQPEGLTPGRSLHYASTCQGCSAGCGLLVKCRDGRPIKLEGNLEHPLSVGGLCAVGQASILGLYDRQRLQHPLKNLQPATWREVDTDIRAQLEDNRRRGGIVRVLSGTIHSPTLREQLRLFLARFPGARHIVYDPLSCSAIRAAHERTHGVSVLPHYRLDRADVIVSLDADFLGTWISPVEFTWAWHQGRSLTGTPPRCSWHVQLESRLSLTGAKADLRLLLLPGQMGLLLTHLAQRLASPGRVPFDVTGLENPPLPADVLDLMVERLRHAPGRALVLCGSDRVEEQVLVNYINHLLGSYGSTIDLMRPSLQKQGSSADLAQLRQELREGRVAALILLDSNPVYHQPDGARWAEELRRVPLTVACGERLDETAEVVKYICPHPHYLACWSDAEPISGCVSLGQPTRVPPGQARTILESLASWSGNQRSARQMIQDHWRSAIFPRQTRERDFQNFWDRSVRDGFVEVAPQAPALQEFAVSAVRPILQAETPPTPILPPEREASNLALVLYPKVAMLDGSPAYNPWLQELPDPITKATWDNYACLAPRLAERLQVREGDVVRVEAGSVAIELPALIQPGQHEQTVAIALGYGSKLSERFGNVGPGWLEARPTLGPNGRVGVNAAPLLGQRYVRLTRTGRRQLLASTQTHHAITVPPTLAPAGQGRRPMIQETTVGQLRSAASGTPPGGESLPNLWPSDHPPGDHRWVLVIDLAACTGCSACVVACQVENNIPVVGKDEVCRQREMHWLRIDRYYAETSPARGGSGGVDVAFQPMMCQHCGQAPCETVCPVLATVHSSDGLNQQIYNRCVGTRYCANNCPYKVRRFNWFEYPREDALQNLVLNPDVTVRTRGVMEKCSFCVQRIQEAKLEARHSPHSSLSPGRDRGRVVDGAVQTACQQSCPAQAIHFGDMNDPQSTVYRLLHEGRRYQVLGELNVQPSVHYLKVVRNREETPGGPHHD